MFLRLQSYERPGELAQALELLARPGAKALAGGTRAVGRTDRETTLLVDLAGLGLRYIRTEREAVTLGAMTPLDDLTRAPELLLAGGGLLAEAVERTGPPTLLNRATIGGALARPDGAPELVAALLALDARLSLVRPDDAGDETLWQEHDLAAYLREYPAVLDGALIGAVQVPQNPTLAALERVARTPRDVPAVTVVAVLHVTGGTMHGVRLAAAGAGPLSVRLTAAEQVLEGAEPEPAVLDKAAGAARVTVAPASDLRGSAEYRRHLVGVLARRALVSAIGPQGRM